MKRIISLSLAVIFLGCFFFGANAQNYDVGVFYMPFWGNKGQAAYSNQSQQYHHWYILDRYNSWLASKPGGSSRILKPYTSYGSTSHANYYNEESVSVTYQQIQKMKQNSIDFVIFDSYWKYHNIPSNWLPYWNHVIESYVDPSLDGHRLKFAIFWADQFTKMVYPNPDSGGKSTADLCKNFFDPLGGLDQMVNYWRPFIEHPDYKKINGKPVFYIIYNATIDPNLGNNTDTVEGLCGACTEHAFFNPLGANKYEPYINHKKAKFFLDRLEEKFGQPLYFVAVVAAGDDWKDWNQKYDWYINHPIQAGFDAVTTYGWKAFDPTDIFINTQWWNWDWSYNYNRMRNVYNKYYNFYLVNYNSMLQSSGLKFHVPVTAGFNSGSLNYNNSVGDSERFYAGSVWDQAISTPTTFGNALNTAKTWANNYSTLTNRTITVCCWNEYAEGAVIEPTVLWGDQYLQKINATFPNPTGGRLGPNGDEAAVEINLEEAFEDNLQVYPNPVQKSTTIKFGLEKEGMVSIKIIGPTGQLVEELTSDFYQPGNYEIAWNSSNMAKGIYFCTINGSNFEETRKLVVE